ncbi:MAG TPA: hypothetical protein VNF47_27440 [Streptosporangiaceae bacterium]|nr:hypothetical protein [Streptosporangiaceae bacterium]
MRMINGLAGRGLAAGLLAAGLAAVAACDSSAASVALPKKPARAQLAGAAPARPTARQLVVAAYEGYWQATNAALDSRSGARARTILVGYIPGAAIPSLVRGMQVLWRRHEVAFGSPVFHIMSVKLTSRRTAAVHDCVDLSHVGFQDQQTGQVVGGLGQSHDYLITTLVLDHGRWLVTGAIPVVQACAY